MKLSIKQYLFINLFGALVILYGAFFNYYFVQRDAHAQVIMENILDDLSELGYSLAKHVRKEPLYTTKSLIDRKVITNSYIKSIAIFDDDKLLMSTENSNEVAIVSAGELYNKNTQSIYTELINKRAVEGNFHYYQGKKLKFLTILFYIDHQAIKSSFAKTNQQFIVLITLFPILVIIGIWVFLNRLVVTPLELLRQYAYYQSSIPTPFTIKEIEYIRASMAQTFSRLEQEKKKLYNLSITDPLSGLSNRTYLLERLKYIIADSQRNKQEFALLFLDLDHFKRVNDLLGHNVGDELLQNISMAIQSELRLNDVVARIGGDEFVIVLTHYNNSVELIEIIERIQRKLSKPWLIQTYPINITSSIGITIYPKDGCDATTLMKNADIAMYEAKDKGRQRYYFFTKELNEKTQKYIMLNNAMKQALEDNEYHLYYQPQQDINSGDIIGAEALIRWISTEKGIISPNDFIPIAENNNFIIELGYWVLEEAIKQKSLWEKQGIDIEISINVAAKQLQQHDFVTQLQNLLTQYSVTPAQIVIEITEYVFLHDNDDIYKVFHEIKQLGVQISLDDFGTGYSSLSYLKNFPIDILKIDKLFIDDYNSEKGAIFINTIITMAHTLQLKVIAEGVETRDQVDFLHAIKCDYFQGYYGSKPLPIAEFNQLLLPKQS